MTRLSLCLLSITAAGLVLSVCGAASADEFELKNDALTNNSQGTAICGFNIGEGFGARFTPPVYPAKLLKVRVLMTNVGLSLAQCNHVAVADQIPLGLEVFHSTSQIPGTSLLQSSGLGIGNDTVLNEVDVSAEDVSIEDGSFFVAFTLESDKASPMIDQGASVGEGNYIYGATQADAALQWFAFSELGAGAPKGNWAVRVTVDVPGSDGGSAGSTQDAGQAGGAGGPSADASSDGAAGAAPQAPPESAEGGGCSASGGGATLAGSLAFALLGLACGLRRKRTA